MSKLKLLNVCKGDIIDVYQHALQAIRPETLIKNAVTINDNVLIFKDPIGQTDRISLDLKDSNIHVIGGGKSVMAMALGFADVVSQAPKTISFSNGLLSVPKGLEKYYNENSNAQRMLKTIGVECAFGAKDNLPDDESVIASERILEQIKEACSRDVDANRKSFFVVLLSGGGSSCLTSPRYIDLGTKLELIKYLVQKGADIVELNKVRRCFSNIKGGQLASFILRVRPNSVILSLILSDVIGDAIAYIASGPTVMGSDDDNYETMLQILRKYDFHKIDHILNKITTTGSLVTSPRTSTIYNRIVGNNKLAINAAINRAMFLGYHVNYLGNEIQGKSTDVVEKFLNAVERCSSDKILTICGGEVTIEKLPGETWGQGGRAQEIALDYLIAKLKEKSDSKSAESVDFFLAGTTDGQDGPTDVAGCLASYAEYNADTGSRFTLEDAIKAKKSHNSYNFWSSCKPQWLLKTGLTGTNVMDLYMYMECKKRLSKL